MNRQQQRRHVKTQRRIARREIRRLIRQFRRITAASEKVVESFNGLAGSFEALRLSCEQALSHIHYLPQPEKSVKLLGRKSYFRRVLKRLRWRTRHE